jgi:hypothetical protein
MLVIALDVCPEEPELIVRSPPKEHSKRPCRHSSLPLKDLPFRARLKLGVDFNLSLLIDTFNEVKYVCLNAGVQVFNFSCTFGMIHNRDLPSTWVRGGLGWSSGFLLFRHYHLGVIVSQRTDVVMALTTRFVDPTSCSKRRWRTVFRHRTSRRPTLPPVLLVFCTRIALISSERRGRKRRQEAASAKTRLTLLCFGLPQCQLLSRSTELRSRLHIKAANHSVGPVQSLAQMVRGDHSYEACLTK